MAGHIVQLPRGFLAVRILQLALAATALGISAFLLSQTAGAVFSAETYGVVVSGLTLLVITYNIVASHVFPSAYSMYTLLILDIAMVIFWLGATGSLVILRTQFSLPVMVETCNYGVDPITNTCINPAKDENKTFTAVEHAKRNIVAFAGRTYISLLLAVTVVAAIELAFFLMSSVVFGMRVHRYRSWAKSAAARQHRSFVVNRVDSISIVKGNHEKMDVGYLYPQLEDLELRTPLPTISSLAGGYYTGGPQREQPALGAKTLHSEKSRRGQYKRQSKYIKPTPLTVLPEVQISEFEDDDSIA